MGAALSPRWPGEERLSPGHAVAALTLVPPVGPLVIESAASSRDRDECVGSPHVGEHHGSADLVGGCAVPRATIRPHDPPVLGDLSRGAEQRHGHGPGRAGGCGGGQLETAVAGPASARRWDQPASARGPAPSRDCPSVARSSMSCSPDWSAVRRAGSSRTPTQARWPSRGPGLRCCRLSGRSGPASPTASRCRTDRCGAPSAPT